MFLAWTENLADGRVPLCLCGPWNLENLIAVFVLARSDRENFSKKDFFCSREIDYVGQGSREVVFRVRKMSARQRRLFPAQPTLNTGSVIFTKQYPERILCLWFW